MKAKIQYRKIAWVSVALCLFCMNCKSEEDAVEPSFIPSLTTQWLNVEDPDNAFVFTQFSQNNTGFFEGEERIDGQPGLPFKLVGTYTNRNIEFIYLPSGDANHSGKTGKYAGKILGDGPGYTMELTSTTLGKLTLTK